MARQIKLRRDQQKARQAQSITQDQQTHSLHNQKQLQNKQLKKENNNSAFLSPKINEKTKFLSPKTKFARNISQKDNNNNILTLVNDSSKQYVCAPKKLELNMHSDFINNTAVNDSIKNEIPKLKNSFDEIDNYLSLKNSLTNAQLFLPSSNPETLSSSFLYQQLCLQSQQQQSARLENINQTNNIASNSLPNLPNFSINKTSELLTQINLNTVTNTLPNLLNKTTPSETIDSSFMNSEFIKNKLYLKFPSTYLNSQNAIFTNLGLTDNNSTAALPAAASVFASNIPTVHTSNVLSMSSPMSFNSAVHSSSTNLNLGACNTPIEKVSTTSPLLLVNTVAADNAAVVTATAPVTSAAASPIICCSKNDTMPSTIVSGASNLSNFVLPLVLPSLLGMPTTNSPQNVPSDLSGITSNKHKNCNIDFPFNPFNNLNTFNNTNSSLMSNTLNSINNNNNTNYPITNNSNNFILQKTIDSAGTLPSKQNISIFSNLLTENSGTLELIEKLSSVSAILTTTTRTNSNSSQYLLSNMPNSFEEIKSM